MCVRMCVHSSFTSCLCSSCWITGRKWHLSGKDSFTYSSNRSVTWSCLTPQIGLYNFVLLLLFVFIYVQELERPKDADPYEVLDPSKRKVWDTSFVGKLPNGHILTFSGAFILVLFLHIVEKSRQEKETWGKKVCLLTGFDRNI